MNDRYPILLGIVVILAAVATPAMGAAVPGDATDQLTCEYPYTVTDATGENVTLSSAPDRIVVLGPSAAQTVWELGAQDRVVGIDAFSTYLNGSSTIPVVAQGIGQVDYEAALAQDPDLIIIDGNSYADSVATEFRRSDVPVVKLRSVSALDGVTAKIERVGRLLDACEAASSEIETFRSRLATIREAVATAPTPTLFYDLGSGQGSTRYSVGPTTFIGEIIRTAGATNIVANGNFTSPYPQVTNEFILRQDPAWLLVTYTPGSQYGPSTPAEARAAVANSSVLTKTQAYEQGNIIVVNANTLNQPGPRVVTALSKIAHALHPAAFTTTTTTTTTSTTTTTPTTTPTTTGDTGPGFGPGATALAAVVALLLAWRR
ncbi:MAG: ABC transporter substrate-binding protein [Halobacteriaceae archaeon]